MKTIINPLGHESYNVVVNGAYWGFLRNRNYNLSNPTANYVMRENGTGPDIFIAGETLDDATYSVHRYLSETAAARAA